MKLLITLISLLLISCMNRERHEVVQLEKESSKTNIVEIERYRDFLDTTIYSDGYPPRKLLVENFLGAPIIVEGRISNVDSVGFNRFVLTFKVDSIWRGSIRSDSIIKYGQYSDWNIKSFQLQKKLKELIFIKRVKKIKINNYPDSIEYFPHTDFSAFPIDSAFKAYFLRLQDTVFTSIKSKKAKN